MSAESTCSGNSSLSGGLVRFARRQWAHCQRRETEILFGNKKLLTEGVVGQGVVIECIGPASTGEGGMRKSYSVKVRVQFPDGATAEFTEKHLDRYSHGWRLKGDVVPVRYDEADHTKVAVDVHTLEAEGDAESAKAESEADALIAAAEDKLAGRPAP